MVELAVVTLLAGYLLVRYLRSGQRAFDYFSYPVTLAYARLWHRCTTAGRCPLPERGPAILVSNHTCSADPMFLQSGCRRTFCYLTAEEHYAGSRFIRLVLDQMQCVTVARNGHDAGAVLGALRRLEEGRILVVFPEGNLSGVARGKFRRGKLGVALLALLSGAPVYPAYIAGGPRTRKLLLSWLWPPPGRVRVHYGPPVDLSAYRNLPRTRRVLEQVTDLIMRHVEALRP